MDVRLEAIRSERSPAKRDRSKSKAILGTGLAFLFFGGGFLSPLLGMASIIIHSAISNDTVFGRIGTFFMIISIPMILLGSHFMDLIERKS